MVLANLLATAATATLYGRRFNDANVGDCGRRGQRHRHKCWQCLRWAHRCSGTNLRHHRSIGLGLVHPSAHEIGIQAVGHRDRGDRHAGLGAGLHHFGTEIIAVATPTAPASGYDGEWIVHWATEKLEASNFLHHECRFKMGSPDGYVSRILPGQSLHRLDHRGIAFLADGAIVQCRARNTD